MQKIMLVSAAFRSRLLCGHLRRSRQQLATMSTAAESTRKKKTKAVIFDMGGVLLPTPLHVWTGESEIDKRETNLAY